MSKEQKIISLENIGKVKKYETATIKNGFFHYLLREGKILPYNDQSRQLLERLKAEEKEIKQKKEEKNQLLYQQIDNLQLSFTLKKDKNNKVFGSIGAKDIAEQMKKLDFPLEKSQLSDFIPLNKLGENLVKIKLGENYVAQLKINIIGIE